MWQVEINTPDDGWLRFNLADIPVTNAVDPTEEHLMPVEHRLVWVPQDSPDDACDGGG